MRTEDLYEVPAMINENYTEFDLWIDSLFDLFGPLFIMTSMIWAYLFYAC